MNRNGKISYIWPWKFLNTWDSLMTKILGVPLKALNKIFGKDNFFFAELFLVLGSGMLVFDYLLKIVTATGVPWSWYCVLLLWTWLGYTIRANIRTLKALPDRIGPELSLTKDEFSAIKYLCQWRITWTLMEVVLIPLSISSLSLGDLGFVVVIVAMYFATDFTPPGKSVFARARDKLVSLVSNIRLLPQPVPIPVRS